MSKSASIKCIVTVGSMTAQIVNEEATLNGWETLADTVAEALLGGEPDFEGVGTLTDDQLSIDLYIVKQGSKVLLAAKAFTFTIPGAILALIKLAEAVYSSQAVVTADVLISDVAPMNIVGTVSGLPNGTGIQTSGQMSIVGSSPPLASGGASSSG